MRFLLIVAIAIQSSVCMAQYRRTVNIIPVLNLNVVMKGVGNNGAGGGLGLNAAIFGKRKLQLLIEANTDRFIGDKSLYIDSVTGEHAKNAIIYNLKMGAQYFPISRLGFSVTYGPTWYLINDFNFTRKSGFRYGTNVVLGKDRRVQLGLSINHVRREHIDIMYMSLVTGVLL